MDFPSGTIIAWDNAAIPSGWAVCDGNNGTPGLVGRFIRGAAEDADVGVTGGATFHKHTVPNTGTRSAHNHGGSKSFSASGAGSVTGTSGTGATGAPQSHGHSSISAEAISYSGSHAHSTPDTNNVSNNPSHIKRVFIIKE